MAQSRKSTRLLIALGVLLITILLVNRGYNRRQIMMAARQEVHHTHQVKHKIAKVAARVRDLELGQRGYLITLDSEFLEPYWLAVGQPPAPAKNGDATPESAPLLADVRELETLVAENPRQMAHLERFRGLLIAKLRFTDSTLSLVDEKGASAALAAVQSGQGKLLMDAIRETIRDMMHEEDSLLQARQTAEEAHLARNGWMLYGMVLFFYLLSMLALILASRSSDRRRRAELDLKDSNARLNAVINGTDYAVFATDPQGILRIYSQGAERMLGYAPEAILGRPIREAIAPIFLPEEIKARTEKIALQYGREPKDIEIFSLHLEEDGPYGQEWTNIRADGTFMRVAFSVWDLKGEDGHSQGTVAVARDVSSLRKLEDDIRRSNALFNSVINSTDQAIIAVDLEGTLILYNPAAERMEGYEASEFVGKHTTLNTRKTMLRHEIEERADKIRREYGREPEEVEVFTLPLQDDPPGGVEWTFVRKGGERYPVQMSVSEMKDAQGEVIGYMAVIRDISRVKTLERDLQESSARLQAVIDGIDYAIFAADEEGTLRLVNKGSEKILGVSVADMVGRPVTDMVAKFADPVELRARASRLGKHYGRLVKDMEMISLPLPEDGPLGQEWTHRGPDGKVITLAFSVYPLKDSAGRPRGTVGIARDITEIKALERMKNEFVSTVSHELRTPLTSIRGALGLVAGGATGTLPEKAAELISIAHRNSERLVRIINDILDVEKIESGKLSMKLEAVDAVAMMHQAVETHAAYGQKYGVRYVIKGDRAPVRVMADPDRLLQVFANLMSNAAKFSTAGSEVWLEVEVLPAKARFRVQDFGRGIPEAFRGRIFEKFAQAENTDSRRYDGTGLGLNITKRLVEAMNGSISFTSQENQGTTFSFEIPLVKTKNHWESGDGVAARVLVCEDDQDVAALIRIMLNRAGFHVDIANSLEEAHRLLVATEYAAVTLDLMMPDGNGVMFLRQLRADPRWLELPVIVVSARADQGRLELNGDAIGMIDWMVKPIDEERLLRSLKVAISNSHLARPRILHAEDDADLSHILGQALRDNVEWVNTSTVEETVELLANQHFDLLILDLELADGSGLQVLEKLHEISAVPVPVLILSASETGDDVRRKVEATLVKSRMSEDRIVDTILTLIRRKSGSGLPQI